MRLKLLFNLFWWPLCLAVVGLIVIHQGDEMALMSNLALKQVGTALGYAGDACLVVSSLWALWGCTRILFAMLGYGILCDGCGGPTTEKRGRWGDYHHCLNCGRNRSIRY